MLIKSRGAFEQASLIQSKEKLPSAYNRLNFKYASKKSDKLFVINP